MIRLSISLAPPQGCTRPVKGIPCRAKGIARGALVAPFLPWRCHNELLAQGKRQRLWRTGQIFELDIDRHPFDPPTAPT